MPLLDVYGRTHELDAKSIDTIATRLEARRGSVKYMRMLQEYLEAIVTISVMRERISQAIASPSMMRERIASVFAKK
jgi:hypothetical protein